MYRDSCCHTYRTTGDMENGGNTYRHGHSYTSDSFSTDQGHYRNITVAAAHPASWDAVRGGGGGSGSGSYFTSLPRFDWTNNLSSAAYAPSVNDHGGSALPADPHLTCLQLGKRHCFEFGGGVVASSAFSDGGRRGRRGYCSGGVMGTVRCQVEGCEAALGSAKEYHRRHRVCEVHAKAPVVVVMGRHQRFCQQCSRFHALSEFDESKRSCRRRLAGHNERRRKSSHDSIPRARASHQGGALSLLSSRTDTCGFSPSDLSLRCSAALRELIAEHRATILAHQLVLERNRLGSDSNKTSFPESKCLHHPRFPGLPNSERAEASSQVTLDLMQGTSSAFGLLSMSARQQQDESCELWNSFEDV